jgi:predicted ribonuclease YlaK
MPEINIEVPAEELEELDEVAQCREEIAALRNLMSETLTVVRSASENQTQMLTNLVTTQQETITRLVAESTSANKAAMREVVEAASTSILAALEANRTRTPHSDTPPADDVEIAPLVETEEVPAPARETRRGHRLL